MYIGYKKVVFGSFKNLHAFLLIMEVREKTVYLLGLYEVSI